MVFSNIFFIYCFLPVFLLLYFFIPGKTAKDIILIAGSLVFYAWGNPIYLVLMVFSAGFNYYMGMDIDDAETEPSRKGRLIFAVIINLLILCFFKYYGFLLDNISSLTGVSIAHPELDLPIGISFYTFKNLSYIFDVYTARIYSQRSFLIYGVYSTMFPHMTAGPIVRYGEIEDQLYERQISIPRLGIGAEYFIKGLTKKVLISDNLAGIYEPIFQSAGQIPVLTAWIGILAYTFKIYFDFSGYSDMAIGLGKMLGFDFQKNFDYPYISGSITEFWRRWHISLGSWFRDYIYIPLGGNRVSTPKHIRNILIVWALTGLWHGASWNFVLWGIYYGIILLIEKFLLANFLDTIPEICRRIYTFLLVMIGWVFFSQTSFPAIVRYFGAMFGPGARGFVNSTTLYYFKTAVVLFVISFLTCGPGLQNRFKRLMKNTPLIAVVLDIILLCLCTASLVYNSYSPFLYQQF